MDYDLYRPCSCSPCGSSWQAARYIYWGVHVPTENRPLPGFVLLSRSYPLSSLCVMLGVGRKKNPRASISSTNRGVRFHVPDHRAGDSSSWWGYSYAVIRYMFGKYTIKSISSISFHITRDFSCSTTVTLIDQLYY